MMENRRFAVTKNFGKFVTFGKFEKKSWRILENFGKNRGRVTKNRENCEKKSYPETQSYQGFAAFSNKKNSFFTIVANESCTQFI